MIIKWIELEGFKSFKDPIKFEFSDINLILGENGAGKTSLVESIVFTLFGQSLTGESRIDDIVYGGDPKTEVTTTICFMDELAWKEYTITRKKKESRYSITINGSPETQATIDAVVGKADVFLSAFNSAYFARCLSVTEKRALIEDITEDIDYEDIFAEKADIKLLDEYGFGLYSKDEHKRVDAKIKENQTKLTQMETEIGVLTNENLNMDIPARVKEDRDRETALKEKVDLAEKFSEDRAKLLAKQEIADKAEDEIAELKKQLAENPVPEKKVDQSTLDKLYKVADEKMAKYQDQLSDLRDQIINEDLMPQGFGDTPSGECPTCLRPLSEKGLTEANEHIEKLRSEMLAKNAALQEEIEAITQERRECKDKFHAQGEALSKVSKEQGAAEVLRNKTQDHIRYLVENSTFEPSDREKKIMGLDVEPLKKEYEKVVKANREAAIINVQIDQAEEKREENLKRIDILNNQVVEVSSTLVELKSIYDALHPSYLLKKAMEAKISTISTHLTNTSIQLFKEQKNGDLASVFEICYESKGQVKPYRRLSNSETIRCGIELSNMVNRITGRKIPLFVDNHESISEIPESEIEVQIFKAQVDKDKPLEVQVSKRT